MTLATVRHNLGKEKQKAIDMVDINILSIKQCPGLFKTNRA